MSKSFKSANLIDEEKTAVINLTRERRVEVSEQETITEKQCAIAKQWSAKEKEKVSE